MKVYRFDPRTDTDKFIDVLYSEMDADDIVVMESDDVSEWDVIMVVPSLLVMGWKAFRNATAFLDNNN